MYDHLCERDMGNQFLNKIDTLEINFDVRYRFILVNLYIWL